MSHKANTWAWEQNLPALQKIVLLALADRHNADTGRCDPSLQRVAIDCGMSRPSVKRSIKALEDAGLLTCKRRWQDEANTSNQYALNLDQGVGSHRAEGRVTQNLPGSDRPGGELTETLQVGSHRAEGRVTQNPEPVIEPGSKPGIEPGRPVRLAERPQTGTTRPGEAEDLNGWTPSMAASSILQRLKMSGGVYLLPALIDVLSAELKAGSDLIAVSTRMSEAWEAYAKAKPKLSCPCGPEKFFGQGIWRDQAGWSWKDGAPPQVTGRRYVNEANA